MSEKDQKEAWSEYKKIVHGLPTIKTYDPMRDTTVDKCELLIACKCDEQYIVWTNREETEGIPKIMPNYKSLDVLCPHCNRHISERVLAATHSGGVFNAFDFG